MAFTETVKGTSIRGYNFAIERRPDGLGGYERVEHIFVCLVSGAVVNIQPQKGVVKTIGDGSRYENSYPSVIYAWKNNRFYIQYGREQNSTIIEYDPLNRVVTNAFDTCSVLPYFNNLFALANQRVSSFNADQISTDGYFYITGDRNSAVPAMARYNSDTETWDVVNQNPDIQAEILQGRNLQYGFNFTASPAALQGVYTRYLFSDLFEPLFDTIISEATAAGVTFTGQFLFALHTDDRDLASSNRRIAGACNLSGVDTPGVYVQRVIDLLNVSDRTGSNGFDETSELVWVVGWGTTTEMFNLIGTHGIPNPTYAFSNVYGRGRHVGRFFYISDYMEGGGTRFYGFPYALQDYGGLGVIKGQMIFPLNQTWDRSQSLPIGAGQLFASYKCNFGGTFGFSSSDEYVMFFYSHADGTTVGFLRPDNLEFEAYNPVTNPSGYVISRVNTAAEILAEFDCVMDEFGSGLVSVGSENAYSSDILDSAILEEIEAVNDSGGGNIANVTFSFSPDKSTDVVVSGTAKKIPISTSQVAGVVELDANQLFIAGMLYGGIYVNTRSGASLTPVTTYNSINSIYHILRFDASTAIYLGYPNKICVTTNAPSFTSYSIGVKQLLYGCKMTSNYAILSGINLRVKNYYERYAYVYYFHKGTGANALLPNLPNVLKPTSGQTFRQAVGLTEDSYSDAIANAAFIVYETANALTRAQVIAQAIDTCLYKAYEPISWGGTKVLVSLERRQVAGLRGIRINSQADMLGAWTDENEGLSTAYPACYYFDVADPTALLQADYKTIEFQVSGFQGVSTLGRMGVSDDYVCFLKNENAAGNAVIRVVEKADIESAASSGLPITAFERTINIALGSTADTYGFGSGNSGYDFLNASYKPNHVFFTVGNDLYVSIITAVTSGGSKPAIYKVDLATGTVTIWARLNSDSNKALNYNPDTDTCFVSVGTTFYAIDSFTGVSAPYDIT